MVILFLVMWIEVVGADGVCYVLLFLFLACLDSFGTAAPLCRMFAASFLFAGCLEHVMQFLWTVMFLY